MSEQFYCSSCMKYRSKENLGQKRPGRGAVCKICINAINARPDAPARRIRKRTPIQISEAMQ